MSKDSLRVHMKTIVVLFMVYGLFGMLALNSAASAISYEYHRAKVVDVVDTKRSEHIEQEVTVHVLGGTRSGEALSFVNHYFKETPGLYYLEVGSYVLLGLQYDNGDLMSVYLQDIARDRSMAFLALAFAGLLVLIGRVQGLRTLVSLALTAVLLVYYLLPAILDGHDPITVSMGTAGAIALATILIVGGWNLKSLSAILGTLSGVVVAGVLTLWFGSVLELTGFTSEEAHMLRVYGGIANLRGILFGGIILGSLGAVTDVGMSIASAAAEIQQANKDISRQDLFRSAMNVGRDIMGTMANTLILAYVGTTMPILLLMLHLKEDWLAIVNMNVIAAEMLRGMAGSIGLVISIPSTALITSWILTTKKRKLKAQPPARSGKV